MALKDFLIEKGFDPSLVDSIVLSESANEALILENLQKVIGVAPKNLTDLDKPEFTELKKQIIDSQNAKFGELRTKWENENKQKITKKTSENVQEPEKNDAVLEMLQNLQKEIATLKGETNVKKIEEAKVNLLKKHNVSDKFADIFEVSEKTDLTNLENKIKLFSEKFNEEISAVSSKSFQKPLLSSQSDNSVHPKHKEITELVKSIN